MKKQFPTLREWNTPASSYPRRKLGSVRIVTHIMTPGHYECYGLKDSKYYEALRPLRTTNLLITGKVWMVDDPPHWWAIQEHAADYSGHVVVAGLGLGLIVHALAKNPKVTKITVIERNQDVIDMVGPMVPVCMVEQADFYHWDHTERVEGVFFDLHVGKGQDLQSVFIVNYAVLTRRFKDAKVIRILGANNDFLKRIANDVAVIVCGIPDSLEKALQPMVFKEKEDPWKKQIQDRRLSRRPS